MFVPQGASPKRSKCPQRQETWELVAIALESRLLIRGAARPEVRTPRETHRVNTGTRTIRGSATLTPWLGTSRECCDRRGSQKWEEPRGTFLRTEKRTQWFVIFRALFKTIVWDADCSLVEKWRRGSPMASKKRRGQKAACPTPARNKFSPLVVRQLMPPPAGCLVRRLHGLRLLSLFHSSGPRPRHL
jgi:hypothetical protein